jgi:predicted nucleic acid-binding protein
VLVPYQLADALLHLADAELFEPLWSEDILDEAERAITRLGIPPVKARRRIDQMRSAFPNSNVSGYEDLIDVMRTDPKDQHVAAAAARGGAALIVTANIRDFPSDALHDFDIEVVHPDDFLQDQLELSRTIVIRCLQAQRAAYTRPSFSATEFYLSLANTVPGFASTAATAEQLELGWRPSNPLPVEIVEEEETIRAFFPDGAPTPVNPRGAAFLWWTALDRRPELSAALANLTWQPSAWGDYEWATQMLSGHGMMEFVDECPGHEDISYVKFMPNVEHPLRGFAVAPVDDAKILTMVRCPDGWWRAWGLGPNYYPSAAEVTGI